MSKILEEVLAANARHAAQFGAKGDLALPPKGNHLPVAVTAGELKYSGGHAD